MLSDYFAHAAYKGKLRLRLDDTNPSREKAEFQDAIIEDLALMGIHADEFSYTSDYFQYLYDQCIDLIEKGLGYADDTDQETMRQERMDGIPSKRRDQSKEENRRIFVEEMTKATPEGRKWCIRAKISFDDRNKAMRDPVVYRCNVETPHHRTGSTWKVYPTYDFACPIIDSKEGITHALRSTEYTDRNPQYQWFIDQLKIRQVHMWDFARMNFIRTFLSKRKLAKLVDTGRVWGWDDPRMPTIRGVRRRGMTVEALREFILKQGPSRNITTMDWGAFWAMNKKVIDPISERHTAIWKKDAVKVTVSGEGTPAEPLTADKPKHPKNPSVGTRAIAFASEFLLDQEDAKLIKDGEEVTLMNWGNAFVRNIQGADPVSSVSVELNLKGDVKTTEKKLTWLATKGQTLIPGEAWEFDFLLSKDKLEEDDNLEDFLNPVTEKVEDIWCAETMSHLKKDDIIQIERHGFYRVDKGLADWKDGEEGPKGKRIVFFNIPVGK